METVFNPCERCKSDDSILKPAAFGPEFAMAAGTQQPLSAAPGSVVILRKTEGVGYEKPVL